MTRIELIERLRECQKNNRSFMKLEDLIRDIEAEGVLDVQCPPEIAEQMNLPRPISSPSGNVIEIVHFKVANYDYSGAFDPNPTIPPWQLGYYLGDRGPNYPLPAVIS
jgi:hypothetical protein